MGGTFDPIHLAHLIAAEEARSVLNLDQVLFIPAGVPWMKANRQITEAHHRVAMVKLAIESNPHFKISTIELENPGWTYTVDTLEKLCQAAAPGTKLFLLMGWDGLSNMPQWKAPYRISKIASLVAFPRPGMEKPDISVLEQTMPGVSDRMIMLDGPYLSISSTEIRRRLALGLSIRYLVPENVERYIVEHGLYPA
jgi:nicotinate-nucleotide adenylyltransferase